VQRMNLKKELKYLFDLDKKIFKNAAKEASKKRSTQFALAVIIGYAVFVILIIINLSLSDGPGGEELLIFGTFFYIFILGLLGFISGASSMNVRGTEQEFLIPKPISTRGIILKKIIYGYVVSFSVVLLLFIIMTLLLRGSDDFTLFNHLQIFYGGFTLTFSLVALGPVLGYHLKKLDEKYNKSLMHVINIVLLIIMVEFFYVSFRIIIYGTYDDIFNNILLTIPLNIFFALPLSSYFICVSRVYDGYFWLAVFANGLFMASLFYASLKYNYKIHEDFPKRSISPKSTLEREVAPQKSWWKRHFFKEGFYDYPRIRSGPGAIMEKELLTQGRFSLFFVLAFSSVIYFITFLFGFFESTGSMTMELIIPMGFMMFFIVTVVNPSKSAFGLFERLKPYPLKGKDIAIYLTVPAAIFIIVSFWGWIVFMIIIGIIRDPGQIFVFFWMGSILLFTIMAGNRLGTIFFSDEDGLTGKSIPGGYGLGIAFLLFIVILFTIFIHMIVSIFIDNVLKFLIIGLADLTLFFLFIWMFGRDYDKFDHKKRRPNLRLGGAFIVFLLLGYSVVGSPLISSFLMFDDTPTSWDLRITNETVFENQEIIFDDYLYITSTGSLTIENSTILFDNDFDRPFGLYLARKGELVIKNSTLTTLNFREGFKFVLYGTAAIDNCKIRRTWGRARRGNDLYGLEIYSSKVTITNTHISDSITNGIYCKYASPTIINVSIYNCKGEGIELQNSSPLIKDSRIIGNKGDGIHMEHSNPDIINSTINKNHMVGIHIYKSEPTLVNNEILYNHLGNIDVDD
jgi:parallel beta-helix repeat protein